MRTYYVAKTPNGGFVGAYSIEQIAASFQAGEIRGDYVVTESTGPSYAQLLKIGGATWVTISQLLSSEPVTSPTATPVAVAPLTIPSLPGIEESGVASALSIIAVLELIFAPIAGLTVGQENMSIGWMIFLSGLISGLILFGFARVIEHLYESAQRLRRIEFLIQKASDEKTLPNETVEKG